MDIGARAYHDVAQTIAREYYQVLALNSTRWDTDNIHDDVSDNSRLTCRTPGKYVIAGQAHFALGGNCMFVIAIRLNGVGLAATGGWPATGWGHRLAFKSWDRNHDGPTRMSCMTIWDLKIGDYVELVVLNGTWSAPGTVDILAEAFTTPEFMMQRIGPPGIEHFSQALSGLRPGITYHFRAKATNSAGTSFGEDKTFTTLLGLPAVTTDPATALSAIAATPNGTLDDEGLEPCDCGFEWGLDTNYGTITSTESKTTGETFSQVIGGLLPNTTYHFRAFATNSVGTSYGADRTFATALIICKAYALAREGII